MTIMAWMSLSLAIVGQIWGAQASVGDVDTGCPATSASLLQAKREADKATLESVLGAVERLEKEVVELKREDESLKEMVSLGAARKEGSNSVDGRMFSPGMSALLSEFQNESSEDFRPQCKRSTTRLMNADALKGASAKAEALQVAIRKAATRESTSTCAVGQLTLMDFRTSGVVETCCPVDDKACAGCASFSGGACQACAEGFMTRDGACTACTSAAGWLSVEGKSCRELPASGCSDEKVRGQSSNEACCQCGGGLVTPTPFSYPNRRWSLDSNIVLKPEPRTADRYTVDSKCELAVHNLTIDSTTGVISYMPGRAKPREAFSFECEVTSHQAAGVSLIATVTVAADVVSYSSATLLFHKGTQEAPLLTGANWSDFELGCAPEVAWLAIDKASGVLRYVDGAGGGVSVADDKFFGQDGAVCGVTAMQNNHKHQVSLVAIRPRPWSSLEYDLGVVAVTIGEELHPLAPKPHKEQGVMKPWTYNMDCDVSGASNQTHFTFDRVLSMGLLSGHPVLDITSEGEITVAPSPTLGSVFDAAPSTGSERKAITLACRVFGIFPDMSLAPVETQLTIEVQDTVCWVPQTVKAVAVVDAIATSEAQCRARCRADETCANYKFDAKCQRFDVQSDGQPVSVLAKVTNCTNEGTCMEVSDSKWFLAGTYCPLGRDVAKGGIVYLREHATTQDVFYLRGAQQGDGCGDGEWAILAPSARDFIDKALGIFELRGTKSECVPAASVHQAVQQCSTKVLKFVEEQEEDKEGQVALILDDPGTAEPADFWLHPCDCAPTAWGAELPVDPNMFEHLPANSSNKFIPTPYDIVTGQLTCPSRQLIEGVGIHFQSEEEVLEPSDCEARCREESTCTFFWTGSQHGAATCRLFTGCDNLVREFSLEGSLKAMPRESSCAVADANKCWATTLRRSFLTMAFNPNGAADTVKAGTSLNLPPKPADPTSEGMVAWFKSENAGSLWASEVGDFVGRSVANSVYRRVEGGYGADRPVTYLYGGNGAKYDFGLVLKPTFTLCSVTRYVGGRRQRILQSRVNFLHGHWINRVGVAFYNGKWATKHDIQYNTEDWLVMCGTNGAQRVISDMSNSTNIATSQGNKLSKDEPLYINKGIDNDNSDFGVMEVLTWDRALSEDEMKVSIDYLKWKLRTGAVLETNEHLSRFHENNFYSFGEQDLSGVQDQTFQANLANGYTAEMTGWTHTRTYGHGFLRNQAGPATVVVKGLTASAKYLYELSMVSTLSSHAGQCKVSVNHGPESHARSGNWIVPRLSGVTTANPRGEITFEFQKIAHHVYISGIAIAAVTDAPSTPPKPSDPPAEGMVAWFKSENAGSLWPSEVGDFEGKSDENSVYRRVAGCYGADRPVTYLYGGSGARFNFGKVLKPTFTICSVSRYHGDKRLRILQSNKGLNLLHGHWSGKAGVAHYSKWVTKHNAETSDEDWVVMCGSNGAQRVYSGMANSTNIATAVGKQLTKDEPLYINKGFNDEVSEFGVMEVITWDRALSDEEMVASMDYLKWKLKAGAVLERSEHMSREYENNFAFYGDQNLNHVKDQTFNVNLANGYTAELSGWTHTRDHCHGFLRNEAGKATAMVKGLTAAATYLYELDLYSTKPDWVGQCKISVNHGPETRGRSSSWQVPRLSGVTKANPRGEIIFEFERISHHVYISGIHIAKVAQGSSLLQTSSETGSDKSGASAVSSGFYFMHLYQQCDAVLLLGGMGVQQCARPAYRALGSHLWQHKRPLPAVYDHGALLVASCWGERYRLFRLDRPTATERLQCVNGDWYNSLGKPGLTGLACEPCVQVGAAGYSTYDGRNEQELYFFNRMGLSIYTELGMVKELSENALHKHCLQPAEDGTMTVTASASCPAKMLAQVTGWAGPNARLFKLIPSNMNFSEETDECLMTDVSEGLTHAKCNATWTQQHLLPAELPTHMWHLHVKADERTQDLHKPYSSYCGTSGALNRLDFGQLFGGRTTAGSKCKFAPLILYGEFKDTGIIRDKTAAHWQEWPHRLAENPIECAEGEALTAFKLASGKTAFVYECSKIGGLGSCNEYYSAQVEIKSFGTHKNNWENPLAMMPVDCGQNSVLGGFHFEFSEGGKWGRARFRCCKAGGAPVTFDVRGQVPELIGSHDAIFCPVGREASGRLQYDSSKGRLAFDRLTGKWCVASECSDVTDLTTPVAVTGAAFEVVKVSDFDGEFLGAMPKATAKVTALAEALKMPPPKRPEAPPMPELEEFKAQQPKYAAECLNYQDLWKSVSETFKDEEDEDVQKTSKLEADPSTKDAELKGYHPCEVAKGAGGIFGAWGKGDGSTAPENMMYSDWNDCMQGDIERDLASAQIDYNGALSEFIMEMTEEVMGMVCGIIPDVMIAPFGAGIALNPGAICDGIAELMGAISTFAGPASGFHLAGQAWAIEQEGYAACNPIQIGFARTFCDIHCVRDAVIRGDRSIIRNLELATKKTNNNMKALVKWSVDSARTDSGWLGEKIDYSHTIETAYLAEIHQMLSSQTDQGQLLQATRATTDSMFAELSDYAQAASFDELSRLTAKSAVENFLQAPDLPKSPNSTAAAALLGSLDVLHQTLQRAGHGRDKNEMVARQMAQNLRRLQREANLQLRTLGVYRQESNASSHAARSSESRQRHEVLVSLDHIWWQLRNKLDAYLEVAEDEIQAFQNSLAEMRSYMDCQKGYHGLAASYTANMATLRRSHRHLRTTWRQGSNLIGELASVLADSEAFKSFVDQEGCKSALLEQTLQQLRSSIFGMAFLLHRFRSAKLPDPDTQALKQATQRIQEAYAAATKGCV